MSEQKFRVESDLIGELQVPADAYYGVQTQRAINNYKISTTHMYDYPEYIIAMAYVKMAAAAANTELGVLPKEIGEAIIAACKEIVGGKLWDQFPVDMMQGGAGTSVNMNANEVIANSKHQRRLPDGLPLHVLPHEPSPGNGPERAHRSLPRQR